MLALIAREMLLLEHPHHSFQCLAPDFAAVVRIGIEAESLHNVGGGAATGTEFATAVAQHIQRGDTLGDHERVVARHQDHREAKPDRLCALRQRRKEHFRTGAVADFGEEVLLGEPEMAEPRVFRRDDMVQVLPVDVPFGVFGPRFRHLDLAQQSELHLHCLPVTLVCRCTSLSTSVQISDFSAAYSGESWIDT
jgi:hypothetical protein